MEIETASEDDVVGIALGAAVGAAGETVGEDDVVGIALGAAVGAAGATVSEDDAVGIALGAAVGASVDASEGSAIQFLKQSSSP